MTWTKQTWFANTVITRHLIDPVEHQRLIDATEDAKARRSPTGGPVQWVVIRCRWGGGAKWASPLVDRTVVAASDPQAKEFAQACIDGWEAGHRAGV